MLDKYLQNRKQSMLCFKKCTLKNLIKATNHLATLQPCFDNTKKDIGPGVDQTCQPVIQNKY